MSPQENNHLNRAKVALGTFIGTFTTAAFGYMILGSQALTPFLRLAGSPIANSPGLINAEAFTNAAGAGLLVVAGITLGALETGRQLFLGFKKGRK